MDEQFKRRLEAACSNQKHVLTVALQVFEAKGLAKQTALAWLEQHCPAAARLVHCYELEQSVQKSGRAMSPIVQAALRRASELQNDR